ncbi:hypothetical protein [Ileibacterium valens]|nr:hypothetical protein [Ileibacterium valens]
MESIESEEPKPEMQKRQRTILEIECVAFGFGVDLGVDFFWYLLVLGF